MQCARVFAVVFTAALFGAACASDAGAPERAFQTSRPSAIASSAPSVLASAPTASPSATAFAAVSTETAVSEASGPSVTISAVGDISLARQVNDRMAQYGAGYPYELILPLLSGDIVFGNLEGALTDRGDPWPKAFNFRTPPQYASGLATAGFDVLSLANNHAMDYGGVGLVDTMQALDSAGVRYVGGGANNRGALSWVQMAVNGMQISFIACAKTPTEGTGFSIDAWAPTADGPGIFVCSLDELVLMIEFANRDTDLVIVSIHAGDEYVNAPNATQRELAEAALAAGADVVLGHHAHVVQPVEQRGNQLIVWGMGNFIFDLDQWDLTGIPAPRVAPVMQITLTKGVGVTAWRADAVVLDAEQDRPRPTTVKEAAVLDALLSP